MGFEPTTPTLARLWSEPDSYFFVQTTFRGSFCAKREWLLLDL